MKFAMNKEPKYLLTFLCMGCMNQSFCNEFEKPVCYLCENKKNLLLLKKEEHNPKNVDQALIYMHNQVIKMLESDLENGFFKDQFEKNELLSSLAKHKRLRKSIIEGTSILEELCGQELEFE
jgi:hypothetical protein